MIKIGKGRRAAALKNILARGRGSAVREEAAVRRIVDRVASGGDAALFQLTKRFDGFALTQKNIRISPTELKAQARKCAAPLKSAIDTAITNITRFHSKQTIRSYTVKQGGFTLGQRVSPLERVGIYIPGGKAPLFSNKPKVS